MAGFLDKNERIIDMVLTGLGRDLLAKGDLRFVYWMPFDDEVDYDPYISQSGSLTAAELSASRVEQTEESLVREATTGYRSTNAVSLDTTNVSRPVFTMPQGQSQLPRMFVSQTGTLSIEIKQKKIVDHKQKKDQFGNVTGHIGPIHRGHERYGSSSRSVECAYVPGSFLPEQQLDGFMLRVFKSGSDGLTEVPEKLDSSNSIVFGGEIVVGGEGS
jgi:hypothetical protein